jgi:aldehyde:ferredoxin oxidoreductase
LCNRYGLDTINLGDTSAFAIEIYQEGIITQDDTDGLVLKWGDSDVLIEITD